MLPPKAQAILLILLLLTHLTLLGVSAYWHSPVPDEPAHLVSGLSHWQLGDFSLYRVNPPLARMWATLPIYLFEPGQDAWLNMYADPGDFGRTEFSIGNDFIRQEGQRFHRLLVTSRCTSALFSVLAALVCFRWARELYGPKAGWLAAWLWCFSPMVLAFAGILTPDVPSAAMGVLALYAFWSWLRTFSWSDAYLAGIALGLAELTKSTWIVLPPLMIVMWMWRVAMSALDQGWTRKNDGEDHENEKAPTQKFVSALQLIMIFATGLLVLNAGYGFQGSFQRLGEYRFQSELLAANVDSTTANGGNRFLDTWLEHVPLPLPKQYVLGFDFHKADVEPGNKLAYLRGELRENGWWYYYLYALAVKCTLGGLLLFAASVALRVVTAHAVTARAVTARAVTARAVTARAVTAQRRSPARSESRQEYVLWLPMLAVLFLLSYHTGLNKHSRYLLPIFPLAIIWASQCAQWPSRVARWTTRICAFAVAVSSLATYPHNMSYFNEVAGGLKHGHEHLINSNVDWGQDLYFLKREMQRRGWSRVGMAAWTNHGAEHLEFDFFTPPIAPQFRIDLRHTGEQPTQLEPGKYAISVNFVHGYPHSSPSGTGGTTYIPRDGLSYFQEFEPVGMIGGSMLLYEITEEDLRNSPTWSPKSSSPKSSSPKLQ